MTIEITTCDTCGEKISENMEGQYNALEILLRGKRSLILGTLEPPIEVLIAKQRDPKDPSTSSRRLAFCREQCFIKRVFQLRLAETK
jgi:hypothetical protein